MYHFGEGTSRVEVEVLASKLQEREAEQGELMKRQAMIDEDIETLKKAILIVRG